jgi:hypothetical protein
MNNNTQFKALHILGVHNENCRHIISFSDGSVQMSCSKSGSDYIRYSCGVLDYHFKSEVEFFLSESVAPSTANLCNRGLEFFNSFRKDCGLNPVWPVPLQDIVAFIVFMFKSGLTHSTVSCYISGLSFHNKINELDDDIQKFVVRKLNDGIKRSKSPQKDSRLHITMELLVKNLSVCQLFAARIMSQNYLPQLIHWHIMVYLG